jgi:hypothetical protein
MSENSGTPGAAGAENGPSGTFDQTGGLMEQYEGEDGDGRNQGAGPDEIGNPLRPGGQEGALGGVAEGEQPQLNPDDDEAAEDPDERNP